MFEKKLIGVTGDRWMMEQMSRKGLCSRLNGMR